MGNDMFGTDQSIGLDIFGASHTTDIDAHISGGTAGQLLVVTGATTAVLQNTGVKLTAPDIQGVVTAAATLTLPAFTAGGAISLGANRLKTTTWVMYDDATYGFFIKNLAETDYGNLSAGELFIWKDIVAMSDNRYLQAYNADGAQFLFYARDNGVGIAEITRLQGAADPYVQIGRDDTGVALNAVTDMLFLQAGGGTGNAAANFGFGLPVYLSNASSEQEERASIDFVLTDATNASEDVEINFKLQIAGAATAEVLSIVGTGIDLPTGKVMSVAGTQVVGARVVDARCDDVANSGDATTDGLIDALRDAMITHGLIAAA